MQAENYVIDHGLADIISQSFGATEQTFPSTAVAHGPARRASRTPRSHDVTVLAGSGDTGSTNFQANLSDLYTMPVTAWPSTDPLVTAVGGTELSLDATGARISPDVVWNDSALLGQPAAGGGGLSSVFNRPELPERRQKTLVDGARGVPDISMSAGVDGAVWVYYSFLDPSNAVRLRAAAPASRCPSSRASSRWPTRSPGSRSARSTTRSTRSPTAAGSST